MEIPQKYKNLSTISIPLLGIYKTQMKLAYDRAICTSMFIAAKFTEGKI